MSRRIRTAFVLGAGLGTRLRPLTALLPKPMVPVYHKPLIEFAFDHLIAAGIERLIVNTHHLPEAYAARYPEGYRGIPITFRHEPLLLDTGGGIRNVAGLLGDEPLLIYNGDILTDLPLAPLIETHLKTASLVTLALRRGNEPRQILFDRETGLVRDIRKTLGRGEPEHLFTGIYVVDKDFLKRIPETGPVSVIPVLLESIAAGETVRGVEIEEGSWSDLGSPESYLDAHRRFVGCRSGFTHVYPESWPQQIHPEATVSSTCTLSETYAIGPKTSIADNVVLKDSIIWPATRIPPGSVLDTCVAFPDPTLAEGFHVVSCKPKHHGS